MRSGQSLVEILIAVAIGVILIGGAVAIIAPTLKISAETNESKIGASLGRELFEKLRVVAQADWHNIDGLATGTVNIFYVSSTGTIFNIIPGFEEIVVATTTYTRFFYIEDACRDVITNNVSGTPPCVGFLEDDPATKKATVVYRWPMSATNTFATIFTRNRTRIFRQTDWSGGAYQLGPVTSSFLGFATSSNLNFSSSAGSVFINEFSN